MKSIIKKLAVIPLLLALVVVPAAPLGAQTAEDVCKGITAAGGSCDEGDPKTSTTVNEVVAVVINTLTTIVGIVSVIMIIVGGFKYITSSGDSANVQSAKNTILYAIVGLVIVAMAKIITGFVLDKAT